MACSATPTASDDDARADELTNGPSVTLTESGLVGDYFDGGTCIRYSSLTLRDDKTFAASPCAVAPSTASPLTGRWALSTHTLTLTPSTGAPLSFELSNVAPLSTEPALATVRFAQGSGSFPLAKRMPADSLLATMKLGDTREFRYENGRREGAMLLSLSAVKVPVQKGQHLVARLEADRPLYAGYFLPRFGTPIDWRHETPLAASGIEFYHLQASQKSLNLSSAVRVDARAVEDGEIIIVFASANGPDALGDGGMHLRISIAPDGTATPAQVPTEDATLRLTESSFVTQLRRSNASSHVRFGPDEAGKMTLTISRPPCAGGQTLIIPVVPDETGGYSGLLRTVNEGRGYAYGSVRAIDGRIAVHAEVYDDFFRGEINDSPYSPFQRCKSTVQGQFE